MAAAEFQFLESAAPSTAFLTKAKRLYDLGIALPVLLYACGFVVLGCYSMEHNLGLQAFPTIQFFSSGAAFLLILAAVMGTIAALRALINKYFHWLDKETRFRKFIEKTVIWVVPVCIVASVIFHKLHWEKLSYAVMLFMLLAMLLSPPLGGDFVLRLTRFYLYSNGFIAGVALLTWYAFVAYPAIPGSFGGGKPQHAYVQVDGKATSTRFQNLIQHPVGSGDMEIEADIYLITDNTVLMKVPLPELQGKPRQPAFLVLQLRRSDVSSIFWVAAH